MFCANQARDLHNEAIALLERENGACKSILLT